VYVREAEAWKEGTREDLAAPGVAAAADADADEDEEDATRCACMRATFPMASLVSLVAAAREVTMLILASKHAHRNRASSVPRASRLHTHKNAAGYVVE
jgi:hypothetical protein